MNRRTFIQSSIATGLLASLPTRTLAATHQIDKVGVQLYTVRDAMKKDFAGTIAKVASTGYKEVEFAGFFDHSPAEVRAILDKNGLTAPSSHVGYDIVEKHWQETIAGAKTVGQTYIVCPWIDEKIRKSPDGWKRVSEFFNKAGETSKAAGIQLGYHNHTFEFMPDANLGGKLPYDFLLENTDPKLVVMEMDLCWAIAAGQDPVTYFTRYPGRFPLVHVKDMKKLPPTADKGAPVNMSSFEEHELTDVGSGVIDWKRIFAHADQAGIKHYFVEQDFPADPFASIAASYTYLSALRF